jgi:lipopolysaccharide export system permease protein
VNISATSARVEAEKFLKFKVERHRKFTLAAACFLLFLIGAPLGSIIRKGGVGLPLLWAIIFFLLWYIVSFTGEKLATSGAVNPAAGMWMSSAALLPLAIFLIHKARADSPIFTQEWYSRRAATVRRFITSRRKKVASDTA